MRPHRLRGQNGSSSDARRSRRASIAPRTRRLAGDQNPLLPSNGELTVAARYRPAPIRQADASLKPRPPPPLPALSQSPRSTDLCAILKTRPYRPESVPPLTAAHRDESRKTGFSNPPNSSNDQTTNVRARTSSRRSRPLQSSHAIRPPRSLRRERNPRRALPRPAV